MINEGEYELDFGTDEEFYRRLNESRRRCVEWFRTLFWTILNCPCSNWLFIKSLPGLIKDRFFKQYIAVTVCFLSIILLCVACAFVSVIAIAYSFTSVVCSGVTIFFQKGYGAYTDGNSDEVLEQKRLLEQFSRGNTQEADKPAGNEAGNKRQPSQTALETLMEPRRGSGAALAARNAYQVPFDFHRSDIYTQLNNNDSSAGTPDTPDPFEPIIYGQYSEGPSSAPDPFPSMFCSDNSAGPSSDPDPFPPLNYGISAKATRTSTEAFSTSAEASRHSAEASRLSAEESHTSNPSPSCKSAASDVSSGGSVEDTTDSFVPTYSIEDSFDSDEPPQLLSEARLSADAIRAFGAPFQVLGAESYRVSLSSDELCSTNESSLASSPSEVHKTAAVSVEIHPDSHRPINSSNDGSSSAELPSMASDESAQIADSDLHSNIPYMDDPSSETTCSTHLDEESTNAED